MFPKRISRLTSNLHFFVKYLTSLKLYRYFKKATYIGDGILTTHFIPNSNEFRKSFTNSFHLVPEEFASLREIQIRAHIVNWCFNQTKEIPGSVVELGVWYGILTRCLLDLQKQNTRKFYLFDSWGDEGFQIQGPYKQHSYKDDIYHIVKERFNDFPVVVLVRGSLPYSYDPFKDTPVSFLMIDLNSGLLEIEMLNLIWPRMSSGAIVYFDDYGQDFPIVRQSIDSFVLENSVNLLCFPTGQAIIIKK